MKNKQTKKEANQRLFRKGLNLDDFKREFD
jgi:hypothetical protein